MSVLTFSNLTQTRSANTVTLNFNCRQSIYGIHHVHWTLYASNGTSVLGQGEATMIWNHGSTVHVPKSSLPSTAWADDFMKCTCVIPNATSGLYVMLDIYTIVGQRHSVRIQMDGGFVQGGGSVTYPTADQPSTFTGTQYALNSTLFQPIYDAGFHTEAQLLPMVCIGIAESSLWDHARNWHPEYPFRPATDIIDVDGGNLVWSSNRQQQMSSDRGIFQISSHSWPQYTDPTCDSLTLASAAAWTISSSGTNFNLWDTYISGAAQAHYDAAVGGWPAVRPLVQAFLAGITGTGLFTPTSTWNTPIPAGATFTDNAALHGTGWIETHTYGVPVVHAVTSDPLTTITFPASWGWSETSVQVHCPSSMTGATGTDGSIAIIEPSALNGYAAKEEYDFWQFRRTGPTTATAQSYAHCNTITSDGWGQLSPFKGAGIHAAGNALLSGLIVGNELTTSINHTLNISMRGDLVAAYPNFVAPAISCDGSGGPIKEGMRVGIPPNVAIPAGLTTQEQRLWIACQTYGCYVTDVNGGNQAIQFWGDGLSVPDSDINGLINPVTFATTGMNAISAALRIVT